MNSDDYQKVKEIFHSVLEIEPEGRGPFLDERCADDVTVRREVERLLASYDTEYLERSPVRDGSKSGEIESGTAIGHYIILEKIGSGGMGEVYLAEDGKLGRRVAIKLLPEAFTEDDDRLRRFQLEARTASALNHPNILTIHEIGETESTHYIATEYIDGETLRARLKRGRLVIGEALDIAVQAASALATAHEAGIIHRDIKPENIMIRRDGLVKVLDFGLAKLSQPAGAANVTEVSHDAPTERHMKTAPGMIMGTVQYMSPEQTRGHPTDSRTDIWSLGVVLYEMLSGEPPFKGENSADLIAEIVKTHPSPLPKFTEEIPERLDEIVGKALEKNPDERYQNAKDLLIDLKRLKRNLDLKAEIERSHTSAAQTGTPLTSRLTVPDLNSPTRESISSAEFVISEIKGHKRIAVGALIILLAVAGASAYFALTYLRSSNSNDGRFAYAANIRLAAEAMETSNLDYAKQLLDATRPKKGEKDLRDFEWGYLARLHAERMASQPITLKNEGWVNSVAFSADGKTLATGSNDARLWDVSTGEQTAEFKGHSKPVVSVEISPDGTKLATGSFDLSAKLWEISTGNLLWTVNDPGVGIAMGRLAFSSDGKTLYTETAERKIRNWEASTGKEILDQGMVHSIRHPFALSPDGKYIAGQSEAGFAVDVKEIATGRTVTTLKRDIGFVIHVSFAPDSKSLLIWGSEGIVFHWELPSGKQLRRFDGVTCEPEFSPDGRSIAMCSKDAIKLWDVEKGHEIASLRGHIGKVISIAFSPDGLKLASGGDDNTAKIWNIPSGETRGVLRGHTKEINGISFSLDSKLLASAGDDKTAKIWDVETEQSKILLVGHSDVLTSTAFSPDTRTIATVAKDKTIKVWDVASGKQLSSFGSLTPESHAYYSPNGKLIATANWWDGTEVKLWDAATGDLRCSFPIEAAWGIRFSRDGTRITASGDDKTVKLWDTSTCAETWVFNKESDFNYFVAFAPDDKLMAFQRINGDRSLRMIDMESGKESVTFSGHEEQLATADVSANGKRLITGDKAGLIKIWDVVTGQELLTIKTGIDELGVALSPDGKIIAAIGGSDRTSIHLFRANALN